MPQTEVAIHKPTHPTIIWDVTTHCNFACTYCYSEHMPNRTLRITDRRPIGQIVDVFAERLPGWSVNFLGGEPFVYRDLPDLLLRLSVSNLLGIYTNLTLMRAVQRFAENVPPERVMFVNCGLHITERVRTDPTLTGFVSAYRMLTERSFPASASYILHPTLLNRVREDVTRFRDFGIELRVKVFRGVFDGRSYPEAYPKHVFELLAEFEPATERGAPLRTQMSGLGHACKAGRIFLEMDVDGDCYRCYTDRAQRRDCLGNLFDGSLRVPDGAPVCRNEICLGPRQGMAFSSGLRPLALASGLRASQSNRRWSR